jgi:preprotein translocase subunit SecB
MPTDKRTRVETDRYTNFVRSLELSIIALTSSSARIKRKEYFATKEPDLTVDVGLKPSRVAGDHFDLHGEAKVKLTRKRSGPLFELSVTYELHFHGKPPMDAKLVRRFADSDAHVIFWPYLREYVSDMSARMYIPPILLPVPI